MSAFITCFIWKAKSYFFFGLKGDISIFPNVSSTGKTFKINFITKIIIAYCQFKKIMEIKIIQCSHAITPTQLGNIGSLDGRRPSLFACIILMSKVVIDEVIRYITVNAIMIGELHGVLNSVIMNILLEVSWMVDLS